MAKNNIINVSLFGEEIGRIGQNEEEVNTSFQFNPEFLNSNKYLNLFPKTGIIKRVPQVQVFKNFNNKTFKGLPPQFADSLPDMFGSLIFKTWLDSKKEKSISILEQLAYVANRGMGALEYKPSKEIPSNAAIDLNEIIEVLQEVLDLKRSAQQKIINTQALINIFKIGTSAGGARPKILISEHKENGNLIPGDLNYSNEYSHYLVKLGINEEEAYSREVLEYCYYLMAKKVGIEIMDSKLIENKHFATLRFDRQNGSKNHILTATGMTGWDFRSSENSSYEQLFKLCSFLKIPHVQKEELFKRMIFNVIFRNTDDHLKNHSFIYNEEKDKWRLSPAYDLTFALNPLLDFRKANRALSVNNKRNGIRLQDVLAIADKFTIKNPKGIIKEVQSMIEVLKILMKEYDFSKKVTSNVFEKLNPLL